MILCVDEASSCGSNAELVIMVIASVTLISEWLKVKDILGRLGWPGMQESIKTVT